MSRLTDLRRKICQVEEAIDSVMTTGQSYSITGSMTVTLVDIDKARDYLSDLKKQAAAINGNSVPSRMLPDWSA